ncbi:PTS galactitol transporter subunit IIC [Convivina praedatoris]|uniref:PTS system galactitol-specific EIIC component n=1 Tax=Convivina praedatoris TaxID=2880963 RepID=A0ABN8HGC1_9LACO|nr:PTS transporter subunit IIC [Convivina sp. LMG 32447]CAH1852211.1 PTS system galactitol-specific EIIC component [Convivina sp. LMG 32447]CAH1853716.1 PTS system galactitol-specific EIIC component [Convivina sp. LMG 32447]CAH1854355.1 PTS system galactitol-specific EIIC component [Convivina sp. LMG 32447]
MEIFMNFVTTLGHNVIVPIIIFLVAVVLGVKITTAIRSAILVGVALTGFSWIIGSFTPVVTKIINQMVKVTGLNLPIVDTGWQSSALTAFQSPVGISFFLGGLILETILFLVGYTKVFFPTNLWQNWGFMVWGTVAYVVTKNFWLSFSLSVFLMLISLLLAEIQSDRYSDYYQIPNGTTASMQNIENVIPALLLDPVWNMVGLNKINITPERLKEKMGIFGEPTMIGAILGLILGFLANLNHLGSLKAWGQILFFAVQLATVMTIFPMIAHLFGKAFKPITSEISNRYRKEDEKSGASVTNKKRWFIAVDDGLGYGESATLISGMILMPVMLVLAVILPGNKMIPVVDLIALPFMLESMVAIHRGNMTKIFASAIVWFSLGLYAGTYMAPMYTEALAKYGIAVATGATLIVSFNVMARPFTALIFAIWITGNWFLILPVVLLYVLAQGTLRFKRAQIWTYLARMADKNKADV